VNKSSRAQESGKCQVGVPGYVFAGKDMKPGMALSVIKTIRKLPANEQKNY
jgi:hypothetical protein